MESHKWEMNMTAYSHTPIPEETLQKMTDIIEEHLRELYKALRPYNKYVTSWAQFPQAPTRLKKVHDGTV